MRTLATLAVLALAVGGAMGCVTASTVTDGDRQVVDQGRKGLEGAIEDLEKARAAATEGSESWTMIGLGISRLNDVKRGAAHLQEVHGPPKEPKPYSAENMTAAIAQSKEEHAASGLTNIVYGAGGVLVGIASAYFGMPWLAGIFPKLTGKTGELAKTGVEIFTSIRKKSEESGGSIGTRDMLKIAREFVVSAGVEKLVAKQATAFEEKLGYKPAVKLDEPAASALPAPAPTA